MKLVHVVNSRTNLFSYRLFWRGIIIAMISVLLVFPVMMIGCTDNLGDETDNLGDETDNLGDETDNLGDETDNLGDEEETVPPFSIFFPVQKAGRDDVMEALLPGKMELDNGYIRIKYFDDDYLLIWPPGFSLLTEGEEIWVINDAGQPVAQVGDTITVSGGEVSVGTVEMNIDQQLPDDCEGPFWLIGNVVEVGGNEK